MSGSLRWGRIRFAVVVAVLVIGVLVVAPPALGGEASGLNGDEDHPTGSTFDYPPPIESYGPLIYGGENVTNPGWITALFRNGSFQCTASLINPEVVLTAAHCVDYAGSYSVVIGEEYLYASGPARAVTSIYIHPGWAGNFDDTDLALLALDSPVTSLPVATVNGTGEWPEFRQPLVVAGWGQYYQGSSPAAFLQAGGVYASSGMDGRYDPYYCDLDPAAMTTGRMFCFGGPVNVSSCSGDSGGPIVGFPSPSSSSGDLVIYGVVSYGSTYCSSITMDSVAQSLGGHYPWIQSIIGLITAKPPEMAKHTIGLVDPVSEQWYLYDDAGAVTTSFFFGNPGDYPFMGDWDGDGIETPGLYRQTDGYVYLRNTNTVGVADVKFFFGNPGDVPIAGDFNNDGFDTVSIYRPSNQTFYIINKLGSNDGGLGAADFFYVFGNPGDKPFVGDFNGNGEETVGLHRESTGLVYFRNTHTQGNADAQFIFGNPGDRLVAGDWTGDGVFTPALFRPLNTTMYFRYTNSQGNADFQFAAGQSGWLPVSGYTG